MSRQLRREQTKAYLKELRQRDKQMFGGICWRNVKILEIRGLNDRIAAMLDFMVYLTNARETNAKKR